MVASANAAIAHDHRAGALEGFCDVGGRHCGCAEVLEADAGFDSLSWRTMLNRL